MAGRWKPSKEDRTDAEAVRRERELGQKLADIVEFGTEADFVAALKAYRLEVGKEELKALIMQFRAAVREKRGLS
jgi:hypothetical protein